MKRGGSVEFGTERERERQKQKHQSKVGSYLFKVGHMRNVVSHCAPQIH